MEVKAAQKTRTLPFWARLAIAGCLLMAESHARGNFGPGNWTLDGLTKTQVQVYTAFEGLPNRGFLPVKVKIRNGFKNERDWTFSFDAHPLYSYGQGVRSTSTFSIRTPGQSETEHELMVPLPLAMDSSPNTEVTMKLTSRLGSRSGDLQGSHHPNWPSVAFSKGLDGRDNLDQLSDHLRSRSKAFSGHQPAAVLFEPGELTSDWRGYSGFDVIMITDTEWHALEPGVRSAILAWNRLGGRLHLFTSATGATVRSFGIDDVPDGESKAARSLGLVQVTQWDLDRIPIAGVASALRTSPSLNTHLSRGFASRWGLQRLFGSRSFNPVAVFFILIAFAIAVGPVNLFVWAKPGVRHRLFFTTPLISLAASLLLLLIIVFQDGFGGSGVRAGLMLLQSGPGERRAYLVQEQISRTGVLLSRSFDREEGEATFLSPAVMRSSRWTHFDNSHGVGATFRYAGKTLAGDWFQSRSEQAHFAQSIRPTRARIERLEPAENGFPRFFSSIEFGLSDFFYVDDEGGVWKAKGPVRAGQEIEFDRSDKTALTAFWNQARENFTDSLSKRIGDLADHPKDTFFALAAAPRKDLIPTLRSIRWRRGEDGDKLLLVGSPVDRQPQEEQEQ